MPGLVERSTETLTVERALDTAARGQGGTILLSGPAGVGKSSLLAHAREAARRAGFTVLTSSPTPVSRGLAHGVVRDWVGPLVRRRGPGGSPFDGPAAGLAEALTEAPTGGEPHQAWSLTGLDYALSWVFDALVEEAPLLLAVDDVQWADDGSLQVLDLLAARLADSPVLLVLARRLGETSERPDVLDRLTGRATVLTPRPLTLAGVEEMRREIERSRPACPLTTDEVHRLTGGVPFLVREVLRSDDRQRGPAPSSVVDAVNERLRRLGEPAMGVARAVALLGDEADLDTIAHLCDASVADLADPLDLLADADVVTLGMWQARMAHPLISEAVLATMAPSERSAWHRRAATHLISLGRPRQVVASHLVHTLPNDDPEVVALLRAAGTESLESGAPEAAATQLLRAVGETPPETTDTALLRLAATAHMRAGLGDAAFDLWRRALERLDDPVDRAECLADLGDAQMTIGARDEARSSFQEAATLLTEAGHDDSSPALRLLLGRMGMTQALYDGSVAIMQRTTLAALEQPPAEDTHADRVLFALSATALCLEGRDHLAAQRLATRALGDGRFLEEETCDGKAFYVATGALSWSDAYEVNMAALDAAVVDSHRRGSSLGFATASYCRGFVNLRWGRLRQAVADLSAAVEMRERGWQEYVEPALSGLAMAHLCLGELAAAHAIEPELRRMTDQDGMLGALPSMAAGLVRASRGDHEHALRDYRATAACLSPNLSNPALAEWRELTAWSLAALGRRDEARALAHQALGLARGFGAPRAIAVALRTLAALQPPAEALESLSEATVLLEGYGAGYFLARTRLDLGVLTVAETGRRAEGLELLQSALDFGRAHDVPPLARKAARALVQHGVAVPSEGSSPLEQLTPGERRVVDLAVTGRTNRAIAQELFVTVKAVEWHLSNAYRKLGISSRAQLSAVISGERGSSNSSAM